MKGLIRLLIKGYRKFLNPIIHAIGGPMAGCRFNPTCSQYFLDAVEIHGVCRGVCMGIWRILRCNPWGKSGYDPVPPRRGASASSDEGGDEIKGTECECCRRKQGD